MTNSVKFVQQMTSKLSGNISVCK